MANYLSAGAYVGLVLDVICETSQSHVFEMIALTKKPSGKARGHAHLIDRTSGIFVGKKGVSKSQSLILISFRKLLRWNEIRPRRRPQ